MASRPYVSHLTPDQLKHERPGQCQFTNTSLSRVSSTTSTQRAPGRRSDEPGPGRDDQWPVGANEYRAERFDGAPIGLAVLLEFREVMVEGGVDHAVRSGRARAQSLRVCNVSAMNLRASSGQRFGGRVRTRKAKHLMAR